MTLYFGPTTAILNKRHRQHLGPFGQSPPSILPPMAFEVFSMMPLPPLIHQKHTSTTPPLAYSFICDRQNVATQQKITGYFAHQLSHTIFSWEKIAEWLDKSRRLFLMPCQLGSRTAWGRRHVGIQGISTLKKGYRCLSGCWQLIWNNTSEKQRSKQIVTKKTN